jgi:hypothetical protein
VFDCRRIAELSNFFPKQIAAFVFCKRKVDIGVPASAFQMRSSDQSIPAVITFSGEAKAAAGLRKKLLHRVCDSSTRGIHERFC